MSSLRMIFADTVDPEFFHTFLWIFAGIVVLILLAVAVSAFLSDNGAIKYTIKDKDGEYRQVYRHNGQEYYVNNPDE